MEATLTCVEEAIYDNNVLFQKFEQTGIDHYHSTFNCREYWEMF